jgi:RNA polymerase sigma-70 factor (ECF subfamily)
MKEQGVSESELIARAQNGDVAAFETLVRNYDGKVLGFALNLLQNRDDAQDAYQEIFLKAFQALPRFRRESQFSTWLYQIAYHTCVSFLRKRKQLRKMTWGVDDGEPLEELLTDESGKNPENRILRKEFRSAVRKVVAEFSPKRRTIFYLRYQNDLSLNDIAAVMKLSLGAVKNHLFKIHQKLREELRDYLEDRP